MRGRLTLKWTAASTHTPPGSQLKTAQTSSSLARQFSTPKITQKRYVTCVASHPRDAEAQMGRLSILARVGQFSCHHRLGFFGGFGHHFVSLRDAHHFFDGCFTLGDAAPAVLPQSLHAFGNGALLEFAAVALLHDQLSQLLRYLADLVNCHAPLIAGLAAL